MRYIGFLLLVVGLLLIPVFIGVPIFIIGLFMLVYDFYRASIKILVPQNIREKISAEIKQSYIPFQPAIKSMKTIGKDVAKSSGIVFVILLIIVVGVLFLRFGLGS